LIADTVVPRLLAAFEGFRPGIFNAAFCIDDADALNQLT
jgi:hypothetical protein